MSMFYKEDIRRHKGVIPYIPMEWVGLWVFDPEAEYRTPSQYPQVMTWSLLLPKTRGVSYANCLF